MVLIEMHVIFKGNVQGVGFRATTQLYAMKLGITGTVRNCPDGSVEIYAHGPKEKLELLMKQLKEEAFSGHIEDDFIEFSPIKSSHKNFRIIH